MAEPQVMMEIGFSVIYLFYISGIVLAMFINRKHVPEEKLASANMALYAFASLLIGDLGHVGARLIAFFAEESVNTDAVLGIGGLLEMLALIPLLLFWLELWRVEYDKERTPFYYVLIGVGVIGLIIFLLPQNGLGRSPLQPLDLSVLLQLPRTILCASVDLIGPSLYPIRISYPILIRGSSQRLERTFVGHNIYLCHGFIY